MSSPYTAGAMALLLEARPHTTPGEALAIMQNHAQPHLWSGNPTLGFLDLVHRQGAGLIAVDRAAQAEIVVTPSALALGELESGATVQRTLTLASLRRRNHRGWHRHGHHWHDDDACTAVTYTLGHEPALATGASTFAPTFLTSSATVTVLPEAEEVEVDIDPNDLKVDVYRSTGPGGQSVNTTDSAVRITHLPTGVVVAMQDEKSQIQNRAKAMQVLRSRLLKMEQDRQAAEASETRRGQIGGGGRSEKIRTYNYKENRVTDHRVGITLHALEQVLAGETQLDEIVDALASDERRRQLGEE